MRYPALGYFLAYIPCALLAEALSSGIIPGIDAPVGGLVLLPVSAIGQLLAMPISLLVSGWWRFAREQRIQGRRITLPGRDTVLAGFFTAVVVGTTTLNFTSLGVSILFMLLCGTIRDNCDSPACNSTGSKASKELKRVGLISTIGVGAEVAGVGAAAALVLTEPARPRARTSAAVGSLEARRWIEASLRPYTRSGAPLEVRGAW